MQTPPERRDLQIAGALYLVIILCGLTGEVAVRGALTVPGDAMATTEAIRAAPGLWRLGLLLDATMALADVALAVMLWRIFTWYTPLLAGFAAAFRLVQAALIGVALMQHHAALSLALSFGLDRGTQATLTMLAVEAHAVGYDIALLFFAVNSVLTGVMIRRSPVVAHWIGTGLIAAGAVYLIGSLLRLMAPALLTLFAPAYLIPVVAELSFCIALLMARRRPVRGGA